MTAALILSLFPLMMVYAAVSDLATMRIPNSIPVFLTGGFLFLAVFCGLPVWTLLQHLGVGCAVLLATFIFFSFGWMGGGDAKLLASGVLWFGPREAFLFLLVSAVYGGVFTFLLLAFRARALPPFLMRWAWVRRLHDKEEKVPYGVAIALGGMCLYPSRFLSDML